MGDFNNKHALKRTAGLKIWWFLFLARSANKFPEQGC